MLPRVTRLHTHMDQDNTMKKSLAAFLATVAMALAAAANQPDPTLAPLGAEASAGWNLVCQHAS